MQILERARIYVDKHTERSVWKCIRSFSYAPRGKSTLYIIAFHFHTLSAIHREFLGEWCTLTWCWRCSDCPRSIQLNLHRTLWLFRFLQDNLNNCSDTVVLNGSLAIVFLSPEYICYPTLPSPTASLLMNQPRVPFEFFAQGLKVRNLERVHLKLKMYVGTHGSHGMHTRIFRASLPSRTPATRGRAAEEECEERHLSTTWRTF